MPYGLPLQVVIQDVLLFFIYVYRKLEHVNTCIVSTSMFIPNLMFMLSNLLKITSLYLLPHLTADWSRGHEMNFTS